MDLDTETNANPAVHETGSKQIPNTADDNQLERLFIQFRPYLRSVAESEMPQELQGKLDASDLVQESMLRGYRNFPDFKGETDRDLSAWLTEILRNYLIDVRRSYQRGVRDVRREKSLTEVACSKTQTASNLVRKSESKELLQRTIAKLPEEYRVVINLRHDHELSFPEIGVRMERSADAVRMLWGRAILRLGRLLRSHAG